MFAYTYAGNPVEIIETANNLIIDIQGHHVCLKLEPQLNGRLINDDGKTIELLTRNTRPDRDVLG